MTIWDELWEEGNRPRSVHELIMIGNDWLMQVKAEGDRLQRDLDITERMNKIDMKRISRLLMLNSIEKQNVTDRDHKLKAIKKWWKFEIAEWEKHRLHYSAYKLQRERLSRLLELMELLEIEDDRFEKILEGED